MVLKFDEEDTEFQQEADQAAKAGKKKIKRKKQREAVRNSRDLSGYPSRSPQYRRAKLEATRALINLHPRDYERLMREAQANQAAGSNA